MQQLLLCTFEIHSQNFYCLIDKITTTLFDHPPLHKLLHLINLKKKSIAVFWYAQCWPGKKLHLIWLILN